MDLTAYVGLYVGLHMQLARLTDTPEFAISDAEGKSFLQAAQNVARHYSIIATQKTLDWAALIFTAGFIYTPRFAAVARRRRQGPRGPQRAADWSSGAFTARQQPQPQGPAQIFTFHPNPDFAPGATGGSAANLGPDAAD